MRLKAFDGEYVWSVEYLSFNLELNCRKFLIDKRFESLVYLIWKYADILSKN